MIPCICIDDANKPLPIPKEKWVKLDEEYHIDLITIHPNQGFIQGCSLHEKPLENCAPFEYFKLSRFAIKLEDLEALIQLMKDSTELNDLDISKLLKESGIQIREPKLANV